MSEPNLDWAVRTERMGADWPKGDREKQSKAEWGAGPWQDEPDLVEWRHEASGYALLMVRAAGTGSWCGYVGLPPGHPFHGQEYGDVDRSADLPAHGGLTYSGECFGRICHVPKPGEVDDVWWLGFDCAHAGDLSPAMDALIATLPNGGWRDEAGHNPDDRYRSLDYVRGVTEALAAALLEAGKAAPV